MTGNIYTDGNVNLTADNKKIRIGAGEDLQLYHDGTDSYIKSEGAGDLYIQQDVNDKDIKFQCDDGSGGLATYFALDGSDGYSKAHKKIRFLDQVQATFGNADDLQIQHDGTSSYITNNTGATYFTSSNILYLRAGDVRVTNAAGTETMAQFDDDGAVSLYYDNAVKLATATGGVDVTGALSVEASGLAINLNTPSASQNCWVTWQDNGTNKWEIGKNTTNKLYIHNYAAGASALEFDSSSHATFGGNVKLPALPSTTANAAVPILFRPAEGTISGDSVLTWNPAADTLDINGTVIQANYIRSSGANSMKLGSANGGEILELTSAGNATFTGDLTVDGDFNLTGTASGDVTLAATKKIYLDGGGDTYISESSANVLSLNAATTVVTGNLTINGTTTTIDTTNLLIDDPLMLLARTQSGTPTLDSGLIIERGSSTNVGIIWDESLDQFATINTTDTATTAGNVTIASYANLQAGNITTGGQILTPGGSNLALNPNTGLVTVGGVLQASGTGTSSFGGALTVAGNITTTGTGTITSASSLTAGGTLYVDENIRHTGDTDNYINFTTDTQKFYTANALALTIESNQKSTFSGELVVDHPGTAGNSAFQIKNGNGTLATFYQNDYIQMGGGSGNSFTVETNGGVTLTGALAGVNATFTSTLGVGTSNAYAGQMWVQGSRSYLTSSGTGSLTIDKDECSMILGPSTTRTGTVGAYYAGIGFDHLLNFSTAGNVSYHGTSGPHAWIGMSLVSTSNYELSALVFATKAETGTTSPCLEKMRVQPDGSVGINTKVPQGLLDVKGSIRGEADSYTKLLLHSDTPASDSTSAIIDSSPSGHTVTKSSNPYHRVNAGVSNHDGFGDSALFFDGTNDYLSVADSSDWAFGTEDFTIDFWFQASSISASYAGLIVQNPTSIGSQDSSNGLFIELDSNSSNLRLFIRDGSDMFTEINQTGISQDTWYHVAVVRDVSANKITMYLNGASVGSSTWSGSESYPDYATPLIVGLRNDQTSYFQGYS